MPKKIQLIIFDLDGTLVDTGKDISISVNFALQKNGFDPIDTKEIIKYVGDGTKTLLKKILNGKNLTVLDQELLDNLLSVCYRHYGEHLLDNTYLYPYVQEILETFKDKKKAVISNKSEKFTNQILSGLNVSFYFDLIFGAESSKKMKPDPLPLQEVMTKLSVQPENTLMVGDGINDIISANQAKIHSCAVGYGFTDKEKLLQYNPEFFITSLLELKKIIH